VGKSSLIAFLSDGKPSMSISSTVGLDYTVKMLRVGEERVVFQLWDTAGQER
jgi:GTPase SAR1 family protein